MRKHKSKLISNTAFRCAESKIGRWSQESALVLDDIGIVYGRCFGNAGLNCSVLSRIICIFIIFQRKNILAL